MITINKRVACAPFETHENRVEVKRGVAFLQTKHELTPLLVELKTEDGAFDPGDTIYVVGEARKHTYATCVYEVGGVRFILIPYDQVVGVKRYVAR